MRRLRAHTFRWVQRVVARLFRCYCTVRIEEITPSGWMYIGDDRIALFHPLAGWTSKKYCIVCAGSGICDQAVRKFCQSSWPAKNLVR